jgi:DNA helicase-2/ATP-dependent DNA helicase PcrA
LEWDSVFVFHVADGKFPSPRAIIEDGGLEEERRLFYVATTRARKRLYYTYPLTGNTESEFILQPSLFLQELPKKLFENHARKSCEYEEPTIVCDDIGERKSFLRSVDEL